MSGDRPRLLQATNRQPGGDQAILWTRHIQEKVCPTELTAAAYYSLLSLIHRNVFLTHHITHCLFSFLLLHRMNEEFSSVKLTDLRRIATLGVGGFGRVELVQIAGDSSRSFALKQMKKSQVQMLLLLLQY